MQFPDGTIDDRSNQEICSQLWHEIFRFLDECEDLDAETIGRIAQTASDLTELALRKANLARPVR